MQGWINSEKKWAYFLFPLGNILSFEIFYLHSVEPRKRYVESRYHRSFPGVLWRSNGKSHLYHILSKL